MITKFLSERFGDPINHHDNEKLNMQNEPAIATCPNCGMLPINDSCDCEKDCSNCMFCRSIVFKYDLHMLR